MINVTYLYYHHHYISLSLSLSLSSICPLSLQLKSLLPQKVHQLLASLLNIPDLGQAQTFLPAVEVKVFFPRR